MIKGKGSCQNEGALGSIYSQSTIGNPRQAPDSQEKNENFLSWQPRDREPM